MLFHASINHNFIIFIVSDGGGTVPWVNINQMYLVTVEMFVDVIASAQKPEMLVFSFNIQKALKIFFMFGLLQFKYDELN